jgi:hypothetical protein
MRGVFGPVGLVRAIGAAVDCALGPQRSPIGAQMPSTRSCAARRRGVRDSQLPSVHDDGSGDVFQHDEVLTSARSRAGYTIDIALEGLGGVKAWARRWRSPGSERDGSPGTGGKKLLLPGAHFRRDPQSP